VGTRDLRLAGKGQKKKKTMVLTLGSPSEKGGEKQNPSINPRQVRRLHNEPAGKGRKKKKKKKNPGFNLGQPAGPRFQDLGFRTSVSGPGF
jgi:hypothetical protein